MVGLAELPQYVPQLQNISGTVGSVGTCTHWLPPPALSLWMQAQLLLQYYQARAPEVQERLPHLRGFCL